MTKSHSSMITLSSKFTVTHTATLRLCLPDDWTIIRWFWKSFAAGVSKETVPEVSVEEMGNAC